MEKKSKDYFEGDVVSQLSKKFDIRIQGKRILQLKNGKGDVGNGSKGKIDFLIRYRGFSHAFVDKF
jgi:hypothetical protein